MWRRCERASYFKAGMLEKALDLLCPLEEEKIISGENMTARCLEYLRSVHSQVWCIFI